MAEDSHLVRRDGRYSVRVRVPDDLRAKIGKREIWEALGTSEPAIASRKKLHVLARIFASFDELRRQADPAASDLQWLAQQYYATSLEQDADDRINRGTDIEEFHALFGPAYLDELRSHLATGETVLVVDAVHHWLQTKGFTADPESPAFKRLCHYFQRAEIELGARLGERGRGDFTGVPRDSLLRTSLKSVTPLSRKPLSELLTEIHLEKAGMAKDTKEIQRTVVETFEDFLGHRKPVSGITRQDVIEFKNQLIRCPTNRMQRFPGTRFHEAIRRNSTREKPYPVLNAKTINGRYLGHLRTLLNWCVEQDALQANPADRVRVQTAKMDRAQRGRHPFSPGQLCSIYSSGIYAEGAVKNARFWAPLIAIYQGLRASEIAQLELDDVIQRDGIWCFHVRNWSDSVAPTQEREKRLKTNAARNVPIHPELIGLGLLQHHEEMRLSKASRLLPDWAPNKRGDYTQGIPRWFNRTFLPSIGIKNPKLVFHSFRHSFKDAARIAGVPKDIHDYLTGHVPQDVAGGYGHGHSVALKVVAEELAKVRYDQLDLARLHVQ